MRTRIHTRSYTNMILTVIAVLLLAVVLHSYRISISGTAVAQDYPDPTPSTSRNRHSATGHNAPIDLGNVAQSQDMAVAGATDRVAEANREIARAINKLAEAVMSAGGAMATNKRPVAGAAGLTGPSVSVTDVSPSPASPSSDNRTMIEVSPSVPR